MSNILLTSYERMRRYISTKDTSAQPLLDSAQARRDLWSWIQTTSRVIEQYLDRDIAIDSYTEYFDIAPGISVFEVRAYPVISVTAVETDFSGLWGDDYDSISEDDYYLSSSQSAIVCRLYVRRMIRRGLRIRYVGGLAKTGTQSEYAINNVTGEFTSGMFVANDAKTACGIVVSATDESLTVEVLYGRVSAGDSLTEYSDEGLTTATGATAVVSSVTVASLAETYPDIVRAAEMQTRYYWQHKLDFEAVSVEGLVTRRQGGGGIEPEAAALLLPYRRYML